MKPSADHLSRWLGLAALLAVLTGCASSPPDKQAGGRLPPETYLRVAYPDADTVEFQTAVRKFVPTRGHRPEIWLAAAAHVGEPAYYAALQRHLDARGLVLFEGIKDLGDDLTHQAGQGEGRTTASPQTPPPVAQDQDGASSLQVALAKSLGLVFQLEAIDYGRPHFRNSDLSASQLQALMQSSHPTRKGGEPSAETEFQELVQTMQGTSLVGALLNAVLGVVGGSPRLQALTKLAMIEVLGQLQGDLTQIQALPPELKRLLEVLILERNKVVIADLKSELKTPHRASSLAVLYGAGHLHDLEKRLCHDLKYRPADQVWLPVFSVNTRKAGLSEFEIGLVRRVVRSQLEALQASPAKK